MSGERERLVIVRSKWARGGKNGSSRLLNGQGCRCCLGFLAESRGLDDHFVSGLGEPFEMFSEQRYGSVDLREALLGAWPRWLTDGDYYDSPYEVESNFVDSNECAKLMELNDDDKIADEDREARIAAIFRTNGIDVVFVDEEAP